MGDSIAGVCDNATTAVTSAAEGAHLPKDIEECSANTKTILETSKPLISELPEEFTEFDLGQEELATKCNNAIEVLNKFIDDIKNGLDELNAGCSCGPLQGAVNAAKAKMLQKGSTILTLGRSERR